MDESHGVAEEVSIPSIGRAVRYHEHGEPGSVLKLEEIPVPEIGEGEVLIQMQATTIHPSDLGLINGSYGRLRELPAVGGREGVGTVVSVGSGVDEKVVGRPVAMPDDEGAWQDYVKARADDLILLPALVPFDQLAISILNPLTAWRLLNDFEYLKEGDFVIQNAGNSAVGLSVVQFAKKIGINLISPGSGQRIDCRQGLCSRLEFSRRTECLEACQVSWRGRRPRHFWGDGCFSRALSDKEPDFR